MLCMNVTIHLIPIIQIIYKVTKIQISTHPVYTLLLGVTTLGWLSRKERQNSSNGFVLARH